MENKAKQNTELKIPDLNLHWDGLSPANIKHCYEKKQGRELAQLPLQSIIWLVSIPVAGASHHIPIKGWCYNAAQDMYVSWRHHHSSTLWTVWAQ